jgi:hypothetical protein
MIETSTLLETYHILRYSQNRVEAATVFCQSRSYMKKIRLRNTEKWCAFSCIAFVAPQHWILTTKDTTSVWCQATPVNNGSGPRVKSRKMACF